jgi:hypothetical protein
VRSVQRAQPSSREGLRAAFVGLSAASIVVLGIYFGSRAFKDFDTALVPYAAASVFAAFALGHRYAVWLGRPPTYRIFRQTLSLLFTPGKAFSRWSALLRGAFRTVGTQRFILRRSPTRWLAHLCLMWGCILAFSITFPLSFGWIRFETARDSQGVYEAFVFGIRVFRTNLDSPLASLMFNALVGASVLVIAGVMLALWRRGRDRGVLAVQDAAADLAPLILLFAISATGLLLTVSTHFMNGFKYDFLSQVHAVTVVLLLVYVPFGKLFHIVQRPTQLGVHVYREAAAAGEQAVCARCAEPFASAMQIADLKRVEAEVGIRYELRGGRHYQDVCPPCRRKNLALLQDGMWRAARRPGAGEEG